jgi:hypothetical protein
MNYEWEIAYINLDDLQLVLRLASGSRRLTPMHIFDTGEMQGWQVGDRIAVNVGAMSPMRAAEKKMGQPLSEEDYTLTNQRTGQKAIIRKNDYEVEDAWKWLEELRAKKLVA